MLALEAARMKPFRLRTGSRLIWKPSVESDRDPRSRPTLIAVARSATRDLIPYGVARGGAAEVAIAHRLRRAERRAVPGLGLVVPRLVGGRVGGRSRCASSPTDTRENRADRASHCS